MRSFWRKIKGIAALLRVSLSADFKHAFAFFGKKKLVWRKPILANGVIFGVGNADSREVEGKSRLPCKYGVDWSCHLHRSFIIILA